MAPSLIIKANAVQAQDVALHLMPFHLSFSGPAPVSTYFLIKDVVPEEHQQLEDGRCEGVDLGNRANHELPLPEGSPTSTVLPTPLPSDSQGSTLVEDSQTSLPEDSTSSGTERPHSEITKEPLPPSLLVKNAVKQLCDKIQKRFVAAFRGRLVQGLQVDLPEGYSGFVLGVEGESQPSASVVAIDRQVGGKRKRTVEDGAESTTLATKVKRAAKRPARKTRRSAADSVKNVDKDDGHMEVIPAIEDEPVAEVHDQEKTSSSKEDLPVRTLLPCGAFSSFVVWNPDGSVDPGSDEYIRSLDEWTRMAALIHSI